MTAKEEREMVDSELLRMLEDVANREIPCQVAYADIQKRIATAKAEERETIRKFAVPVIPGAFLHNDDKGCITTDPMPTDNPKGYPVQVYLVGADALETKK